MNFRRIDHDQARAKLAPMAQSAKVDTSNGLCSIDDFLGAGVAFIAEENGMDLMLFVVEKIDRAHGKEFVIRAALQLVKGRNLVRLVLPQIEYALAWDCDMATIYTRRPGLVAKLEACGYAEAGTIMRKRLQ